MDEQPKVYLIRAGRSGEDEALALEHGVAIIGWEELPELPFTDDLDAFRQMLNKAYPDSNPKSVTAQAGQLSRLRKKGKALSRSVWSLNCLGGIRHVIGQFE